ncbi:DUF4178 domain-containing protein [Clostridium polynesiense]|uniref:DUF4178 domain-containing protein n=1 Tax=Clostridium polynesiense TaxID=1325933 RepID=UPI0006943E7F|nr:DUF4178 domain-containing protein [Clostridium polynesiense]
MEYEVGDTLRVDGKLYRIIGKIQYKNQEDNCRWFEYRLKQQNTGTEQWLSYDDIYDEYSLSHGVIQAPLEGFHQVDQGTEEVIGIWGEVDVSVGDRASFFEYEDDSEENIISVEQWDDEKEFSLGYYLDYNEISLEQNLQREQKHKNSSSKLKGKRSFKPFIIILILLIGIAFFANTIFSKKNVIAKYLKDNPSSYTYVTSITGNNNEKADVYQSIFDLDTTVKQIIQAVKGNVEDVQQNTEDGDKSVAILTSEEYCLVYLSNDQEVLVQISSRKYAYSTDKSPYHAHRGTYVYYRRYYYSRGYSNDSNSFGRYDSPYKNYNGEKVNVNTSDPYSVYSSSIRQSSVNSRPSSGGGLSSGK